MTVLFRGQFDDIAVRITEINRIDEAMIGNTAGFNALSLALFKHPFQIFLRYFKRQMQVIIMLVLEIKILFGRLKESNE